MQAPPCSSGGSGDRTPTRIDSISAVQVATEGSRRGVLRMVDQAEIPQGVQEWNATRTDYPRSRTIHALFEARSRIAWHTACAAWALAEAPPSGCAWTVHPN
jgi:hypothetical protein